MCTTHEDKYISSPATALLSLFSMHSVSAITEVIVTGCFENKPEHGSTKDVSDRSVGRLPHLFKLELLNTSFVRSNGGAFDADIVLLNSVGALNGDCGGTL